MNNGTANFGLSTLCALGLWLLPMAAHAQSSAPCARHDDAVSKLAQTYGEAPIALGLSPQGQTVTEVFVSQSGTWTILVTRTNGISCIVAAGDNWTDITNLAGDPT